MTSNISNKAKICPGTFIGDNVIIEDDVYIDYGVIIRDNTTIKSGTYIGARCILNEYTADFFTDRKSYNEKLVIGENSLIRSETIIYGGSIFGNNFQTGHRVTIREKTNIGNHVRVGTLSDIQGHCEIGNYVSLHSNVHIGQKSKIGNFVWIFPYVVLTNDPTPPSSELLGVIIDDFAIIATMSVILPGVRIGKDALVGAGSIVNKDVPELKVAVGNPMKIIGEVQKIKNKITGKEVYPWRYTFERGMPWEGVGYDNWSSTKNPSE